MKDKLKPAIIGGVVVGLLSALPFVNFLNFCCCLWALLGGALACYLYVKASPTPVKGGDGAMVGVLAGAVGALIYIVIGIPIGLLLRATTNEMLLNFVESVNPDQARMMRRMMMEQSIIGGILGGLVFACLLVGFSTIGGLIGVQIFEKRKGNPPPPPQGFGQAA